MADFISGLLGINEEDPLLAMLPPEQRAMLMRQGRTQGLQNLGAALLQAGGPSRVPTGIGSRFGTALMGAQEATQTGMDANLQRLMAARRMQQEQLQMQRQMQAREAMQGAITPEGVNVQALQQAAMLSDNPLEALSRAAEFVPKARRAGMLPGGEMDNPFEMFAQSPSEPVRRAAQTYSQRFAQGLIDPDAADKIIGQLTNLEERSIGRQESLDARREAQQSMMDFRTQMAEQNRQMREQSTGLQRELAQGRLDLQRQAAAERQAAKEEKATEKAEAKQMKQTNLVNQANVVLGKIDEALGRVSMFTAGPGGMLSIVPGTTAKNLSADLDTIKANLGFQQLQAMRDASPTGGALGQVTERELAFLQSTVASLDQLQSPEQLTSALNQIKVHYNNWLSAVQGNMPQQASPAQKPASGGLPPGVTVRKVR